jgi:hypothetical protein
VPSSVAMYELSEFKISVSSIGGACVYGLNTHASFLHDERRRMMEIDVGMRSAWTGKRINGDTRVGFDGKTKN